MGKFHLELFKLMDVYKSNGYPENFINGCFNGFLHEKHRIQEKVITVPKKPFFVSFFTLDDYHCKLEPT